MQRPVQPQPPLHPHRYPNRTRRRRAQRTRHPQRRTLRRPTHRQVGEGEGAQHLDSRPTLRLPHRHSISPTQRAVPRRRTHRPETRRTVRPSLARRRYCLRRAASSTSCHHPRWPPVFGPPKSKKSRRTVSLDAGTVDRLLDQQAKIVDMREAAIDKWTDRGLVFVNERGGLLDPNNLSKQFAHAVRTEGAGLPHLSIHGLRHTHATHLLAAGVNAKVVADRLGRHSVAFTLDTYTHVMPGQHAAAADAVAALLTSTG